MSVDYQRWIETVECEEVGTPGHETCGWCQDHGVPRAVCLCKAPKRSPHSEPTSLPYIHMQAFDWVPIMGGKTAVTFVAGVWACQCCAFRIRAHSDELTNYGHVDGGCRGNVYWRSKGMDAAEKCDICGTDLSNRAAEELRFWVEVKS